MTMYQDQTQPVAAHTALSAADKIKCYSLRTLTSIFKPSSQFSFEAQKNAPKRRIFSRTMLYRFKQCWVACFSQPTLLGINVGLTIEPLAQPTVTST